MSNTMPRLIGKTATIEGIATRGTARGTARRTTRRTTRWTTRRTGTRIARGPPLGES